MWGGEGKSGPSDNRRTRCSDSKAGRVAPVDPGTTSEILTQKSAVLRTAKILRIKLPGLHNRLTTQAPLTGILLALSGKLS